MLLAGEAKEAARLTDEDPMMAMPFDDFWIGPALQPEHHRLTAAAHDGFGDCAGKAAAAANDGDGTALGVSHGSPRQAASFVRAVVPAPRARPHQWPLTAGADERDHLADQRIVAEFALHRVDAVGDAAFDKEQRAIGVAQAMHLGAR